MTPPATTDAAVTVLEDDREDSIDCRGREVSILGSRNTLRLRGACPMVIVTGTDNEIDVDTAQRIRTTGDRNRVVWTSVSDGAATPRIENTGQQNRISKGDRKPVSPLIAQGVQVSRDGCLRRNARATSAGRTNHCT